MKTSKSVMLVLVGMLMATAAQAEDWKGSPPPADITVGALAGLGVIDSEAGFAVLGAVAKKIAGTGFVPDINNSVWIEVEAGPLFVSGSSAFAYSTHLRWDFHKDSSWAFFALGGAAGHITGESLGSRFLLFPRFGLGFFRDIGIGAALRAEISHEFITAGLSWGF